MGQGPELRRRGDRAEQLVAEYLAREGYAILARNVRFPRGELDLVAERGQLLVFVEVRMRAAAAHGEAAASVTRPKQRRVILAATRFCQEHGLFERDIRFDVAAVVGTGDAATIDYIEDAFQAWF